MGIFEKFSTRALRRQKEAQYARVGPLVGRAPHYIEEYLKYTMVNRLGLRASWLISKGNFEDARCDSDEAILLDPNNTLLHLITKSLQDREIK